MSAPAQPPTTVVPPDVVRLVREALALAGRAGYLEGRVDWAPSCSDEVRAGARTCQKQAADAQAEAFAALYDMLSA